MKLTAELNDEKNEIEIKREGNRVFAKIADREYELEASEPEPNVFLLKNEGKIYQVFVSPRAKTSDPFEVKLGNHDFDIQIFDPKKLSGGGNANAAADGIIEIRTAMPGKLVRVLVEVGNEVSAGDGVLVVEAMKMQNEMKSPKDGIVKEIRFAEGANVNAGEVLAIIE